MKISRTHNCEFCSSAFRINFLRSLYLDQDQDQSILRLTYRMRNSVLKYTSVQIRTNSEVVRWWWCSGDSSMRVQSFLTYLVT